VNRTRPQGDVSRICGATTSGGAEPQCTVPRPIHQEQAICAAPSGAAQAKLTLLASAMPPRSAAACAAPVGCRGA